MGLIHRILMKELDPLSIKPFLCLIGMVFGIEVLYLGCECYKNPGVRIVDCLIVCAFSAVVLGGITLFVYLDLKKRTLVEKNSASATNVPENSSSQDTGDVE